MWDLRLVPAAGLSLCLTLALGGIDARHSGAVAVCAVCAAVASGVIGHGWARKAGHVEQLRMLGVCAAVAAILCGLGAAQSVAHERSILVGAEPIRATVTVDVRAIPRMAANGAVVLNVRVVEVRQGSEAWRMSSTATVFAEGPDWLWLEPGTRVRSVMTTSPGEDREIFLSPISGPATIRGPTGLSAVAEAVRTDLRDAAQGLPAPADALLPSMVLGDQRSVPAELSEAFLASGLSHLAAVSGANIAYVLGATVVCMAWCGVPRRPRLGVAAIVVALFVCVVGPEASVMRAAAMAAISVYAVATGRSKQSLSLLATVVLVFSIASPDTVRALGFVLSVAATAGIVIAASPCERFLIAAMRRGGRGVRGLWCRARGERPPRQDAESARDLPRTHPVTVIAGLVALALVAHLSTAPILSATGRAVTPWAIVKNIAVAPVVPWVTVAGTAAAAVSPIAPPVARALAWTCVPSLWWTATVAGIGEDGSAPTPGVGGER